jgi:hypothetical protein
VKETKPAGVQGFPRFDYKGGGEPIKRQSSLNPARSSHGLFLPQPTPIFSSHLFRQRRYTNRYIVRTQSSIVCRPCFCLGVRVGSWLRSRVHTAHVRQRGHGNKSAPCRYVILPIFGATRLSWVTLLRYSRAKEGGKKKKTGRKRVKMRIDWPKVNYTQPGFEGSRAGMALSISGPACLCVCVRSLSFSAQ